MASIARLFCMKTTKSPNTPWPASLHKQIEACSQQWHLTDLQPARNLLCNYVMFGRRTTDQVPIVLKLMHNLDALIREQRALEAYNGHGCVQLLAVDHTNNALLLERLIPGTSLQALFPHDEEHGIEHAIGVMNKLHTTYVPDATLFPSIADWLATLNRNYADHINTHYVQTARTLAHTLLATQTAPVLLHGDLHHDNILNHHTEWRAIDPKGVLGEPAYEVGAFIRNPLQQLLEHRDARSIIATRIAQFATRMDIDRQRIKEWSYVQAVLAAYWCVQDGLSPAGWLRIADILESIEG